MGLGTRIALVYPLRGWDVHQSGVVTNETSSIENREEKIRGGIFNVDPCTQLAHSIVRELNI